MRYLATFFKILEHGKIMRVSDARVSDLAAADAMCDELKQQHNHDYMVSVLDNNNLKMVHTYSTADWQGRK